MKIAQLSRDYSTDLKGLSIVGVLILHVISALPATFMQGHTLTPLIFTVDQLARFCVPLFIALSGYGLMQKYKTVAPHPLSFFISRAKKLLPLFFLWSATSLLIFSLSPLWNVPLSNAPLWIRFLIGQSDYHLYFVIMILQLYLLFPFLWWCLKVSEKGTLLFFGGIQIGLYLLYGYYATHTGDQPFLLNDQKQYVFALSWAFYFVLGMYLGKNPKRIPKNLSLGLLVTGALYTLFSVLSSSSTDLVSLLRFTKVSIVMYVTGIIGLLFSRTSTTFLSRPLTFLGTNSYLIYLSHPLLFRIVLGHYHQTIPPSTLVLATALYSIALFLSLKTKLRSSG